MLAPLVDINELENKPFCTMIILVLKMADKLLGEG
jgi:hypothetical protein